jgi:hypothetical protein
LLHETCPICRADRRRRELARAFGKELGADGKDCGHGDEDEDYSHGSFKRFYAPTVRLSQGSPMREAFKDLLPPGMTPVLRWRLTIAAVCASFMGFIGYAESPAGFASAPAFNNLRADVTDIKISLIEQQLFDAKESECTSSSPSSASFFSLRVIALSREYFKLAGTPIIIPPCKNQL